jgi:hypothetical protein
MLYAVVTSLALLTVAQGRPEAKVVKASEVKEDWLRPTRIRLDFRDRTLAEIVDGINAQGPPILASRPGSRVHIGGEQARPEPPPRRYSLSEPGPVTLWEAVEGVGRATETLPVLGNLPGGGLGILLRPGSSNRGFFCNDGAFRVELNGTSYVSDLAFAPDSYNQPSLEQPRPDGSSRRPSLSVGLIVLAEPRLKILGPVELVVREAVDDRGCSLFPAVPWRQSLTRPPNHGLTNGEFLGIPLKPLDDPGKRIKRLAGTVALEVSEGRAGSAVATVEVGFDFANVPLP